MNQLSRTQNTNLVTVQFKKHQIKQCQKLVVRAQAQTKELRDETTGLKLMKKGFKEASSESILTPRFYTTDFDEMAELFSEKVNPHLNMDEMNSLLEEFRTDYNQRHFVRNNTFLEAAKSIQGEKRKIFVEFLERSCTAEFSGFLLYKELGRRLKDVNPVVAEIFSLISRDEARHAGFLNKALGDFNLSLDLGFLTRNRKYTFFKPKFIFYATYLSEKIGYWRYISIYRHLQRSPEFQLFPLFEYFENWCQDENRHGDFFTAMLKSNPQFLNDNQAKWWSRFFCHSVYITMYLNDHSRSFFYETVGLNTTQFNRHVIIETNKTTQRIFPATPDTESEQYWEKMNNLVKLNTQISKIGESDKAEWMKNLQKAPIFANMASDILQLFLMKPIECGSYDITPQAAFSY